MSLYRIGGLNPSSLSIGGMVQKEKAGYATIPFAEYLKDAIDSANSLILESEKLSEEFAAGKTDNIHQVLIAAEKADIAFQFTMQIRNKILDAYNEIMRMQI